MAMIALQLVLEKLGSLVGEEAQLLGGVRGGVDELRGDLEMIKSFLHDAESRSDSNQGIRTWVKQVRDVSYDIEDILEDFLLCMCPPQGLLRKVQYYVQKLCARHRLAVQVKYIRMKVKSIAERRNSFCLLRTDEVAISQTWHDPRATSLHLDESDVVGIDKQKSVLTKWLVEGEQKLTAIFVVGMGGLGKTTLVKKIYDSAPVRKCFNSHAWITVSKSFTLLELLRSALKEILDKSKEPIHHEIKRMSELQLVHMLRNHLQQKRYIIVFDDVWSTDVWEEMRFAIPDCGCGSRIIFTTRIGDLAASVETNVHVYQLQPLPHDQAWALFCMKAFRGERRGVCPPEMEKISRSILKKCGGLPLAIVAIGALLWKKNEQPLEWKKVLNSLAAEMKSNSTLERVQRILLLSYNDLPYHLKHCFLYVSVFPEDYLIKRAKLVRLWIAERLVEEKQGLTMQDVAQDYFNELVNRSMIQPVQIDDFNRVQSCRVHDLIREIIQLKSREEFFLTVLNEKGTTQTEMVRRISVHVTGDNIPSNINTSRVHSLHVFSTKDSSGDTQPAFLRGCRSLRVLELHLGPISKFPPNLVDLVHLKYLSMRNTLINQLPESVGKLSSLEVLDLKGTPISTYPSGILKLKNLVQLQCYHYRLGSSLFFPDIVGERVPKRIGCLTKLKKLGTIEVDDGSDTLKELGKLTQLRRLGILNLRQEDSTELCSSLEKLRNLSSLYIVSLGNTEVLQLNTLSSPPEFLDRLYLKCGLATLPDWISSLSYLSKLVLKDSHLTTDPLKALQGLHNLVVLELRLAYDGKDLSCDATGYPKLKKLGLYLMDQLRTVNLTEGAMPGLRKLDIYGCYQLEIVPYGIEHLKNLLELLLWELPDNFLNKIKPSEGEDFWRVEHIPTIKHVYEWRGEWKVDNIA